MKICAFIGDMYRDYSSGIILSIQKCAIERGHVVDVFGNCSVPSENSLHATGLKKILSLPNYSDYRRHRDSCSNALPAHGRRCHRQAFGPVRPPPFLDHNLRPFRRSSVSVQRSRASMQSSRITVRSCMRSRNTSSERSAAMTSDSLPDEMI